MNLNCKVLTTGYFCSIPLVAESCCWWRGLLPDHTAPHASSACYIMLYHLMGEPPSAHPESQMANYTHVSCGENLDLDAQRRVHSPEPMAAKSAELREAFKQQHAAEETVQINCSRGAGLDDSLKK